jgi:sugar diacid utilization regulator
VHQGIPLRGHLTAYRNGMWLLWGELVKRVMNRPALQRELLLRAAWAFRHLDTISGAVTEAYYAEQEGRIRHRDRALRDLFDEIVAGAAPTEELRARAAAVDLHLDRDLTIAVAAPAGPKTPAKGVVLPSVAVSVALAEVLGIAVDQVVMVERSRELILIAPATMGGERVRTFRAKMSEVLAPTASAGLRVSVGLSGTVADVDGVRQGYKEAKRAIEIGHVLVEAELVHSYDDLVLHDVIDSGARPGQRLIGASLGPLLALGETGRRLVETLDAYFRAGANLKVAAGILDIHPNTLAYRMRQIHRLTGLDSNDPEQRLRVEIALRLLAMQRRHEEAAKADHPSSHAAASAARKAARPSEA